MDSNRIHHPSPANKMKCSFFDHVQVLMISWAGRWTWTPFHHPSPAKTVKCSFLYYIQHLMLARLVNGLEPHSPPLSSQKMKCSFLGYVHLLMISQAVWWTQTPSATPLQPIKWNAHFWITFNFWWSAGLVDGLEPHPPPVSCQKWNAHILIMFNFWWLARLVNGLEPHPPPLSSQNSEMLIFVLHSTSDVGQTGQWTWTSSTTPLQPKIWNAHGLFDYVQLLMISRAGQWTQSPSASPLQPIK